MKIIAFGINHKTAPIEIREKFYLTPIQQDLFLSELKNDPTIAESLVLSTCNRTEVYLHTMMSGPYTEPLVKLISQIKKIDVSRDASKYFYLYEEEQALRHFLRVTAGLDSLVLGEKQILGQVKKAVERAREKAMLGRYFNILSNMAIRSAKKAHNETNISFGGSSISWAAINMAEDLMGTLEGKSILIIGAGKMGELALGQVRKKGVKRIYLLNRTEANAVTLAQKCGGIVVPFCDIKETLSEVDICICSAGAPHYILEKSTVEKVMRLRNDRKLILLDISMPRNIDPQVATLNNVFLTCIDDLDRVVGENMLKRQSAAVDVEKIIESKLTEFRARLSKLKKESIDRYTESVEA